MKKLILLLGLAMLGGCGDSDDSIEFSGNVQDPSRSLQVALGGVNVCALGECGTTDANGNWSFDISEDSPFTGGDVLFTLSGPGVNSSVVVPNVDDESEEVNVDFALLSNGAVTVTSFSQDDFDEDVESEVDEELDDADDEADDAADDVDDSADDASDDIDDELDDAADDVDDSIDDAIDDIS